MQRELPASIQIFGINEAGYESSNDDMCEGRDLPWLQETSDEPVWSVWQVEYRDVIVLDAENYPLFRYNLSENDLDDPARYDELKTLLEDAIE